MEKKVKKIYFYTFSVNSPVLYQSFVDLKQKYLKEEDYLQKWTVTPIYVQTEKALKEGIHYLLTSPNYLDKKGDEIPFTFVKVQPNEKVHFICSTEKSDKPELHSSSFEITTEKSDILKFYFEPAAFDEEERKKNISAVGNYVLFCLLEISYF